MLLSQYVGKLLCIIVVGGVSFRLWATSFYQGLQNFWLEKKPHFCMCVGGEDLKHLLERHTRALDLESINSRPECCYKISNLFLIEYGVGEKYLQREYLIVDSSDKCVPLSLEKDERLDITWNVSPIYYAPVQKNTDESFYKIWDAETKVFIRVPNGYSGILQCGYGTFLIKNNQSGKLYAWKPRENNSVKEWNYSLTFGRVVTGGLIATSNEDGQTWVFASGLIKIPNSLGATSVESGSAIDNRRVYNYTLKNGESCYYVYPPEGLPVELSQGTSTVNGKKVYRRNGHLITFNDDLTENIIL